MRNKGEQEIRNSKKKYFVTKLQRTSNLKHFVQKTGGLHAKLSLPLVPALEFNNNNNNNNIYTEEIDKANVLNTFSKPYE